jgi:integrase
MASVRKRIWQSGGKTQTAFVADYFDQDGKRRLKTFKRRRDAEAYKAETLGEIKQGVHTPASASITIAEAGEAWLEQGQTDGLERSSLGQYRQHLDYHIKPFLGRTKLAELTPAHVRLFRNELLKEDRSPAITKKIISSLGSILANAMAEHKVARNVVREQAQHGRRRERRLEKRHTKRLEVGVDIPTKDEIRAMLDHATGRWRPFLVTTIFTGLRASELRGLRWSDVDLDRATLTIRQRADAWGSIGSPKSDSAKRTVPLAPIVVNTLKEWKLACPKGEAKLVFPNTRGKVEAHTNIYHRGLGPLQVAAGITDNPERPKYGLHALRHTAASLFIEQGFSPKRVQALMGHATIQMTFDTYGHLFPAPEDDQAAMRQLQARLLG